MLPRLIFKVDFKNLRNNSGKAVICTENVSCLPKLSRFKS